MEGLKRGARKSMGSRISQERLNLIMARQGHAMWGADYQPAIRATPREAPRISRPTILKNVPLVGRDMHLLSQPEVNAAYLALHYPLTFDIHEQKILSTTPAPHPLFGTTAGVGHIFRPFSGTVAVAERLGILQKHPKFFLDVTGHSGRWVPFPYVGDLLLFLKDDVGPYCVNWNIKLTEEDYFRPRRRSLTREASKPPPYGDDYRHKVEELYYADAEIRSIRVTQTALDKELIANLRSLFGYSCRESNVTEQQRSNLITLFQAAIDTNLSAFDVIKSAALKVGVHPQDAKIVLNQSVWRRELLIDLFRPFLIDKPLRGVSRDPFEVYKNWFER